MVQYDNEHRRSAQNFYPKGYWDKSPAKAFMKLDQKTPERRIDHNKRNNSAAVF